MPDSEKSKKLVNLITRETGIDPQLLNDRTSLFHDFGVAGHDGSDLLQAIERAFEIDLGDVLWWDYFGPEASYSPIYHLLCSIRGKTLDHDIIRLEMSDLKRTVETGIWQNPHE